MRLLGLWAGLLLAGVVLSVSAARAAQPGPAAAVTPPTAARSQVLSDIQGRGVVRCSVEFIPGFASHDSAGRPAGFMVDLCRALAAAVLGDANAIDIRRSSRPQEFVSLETGEVDVSFAQTSWTMTRDTNFQIDFGPVVFHDGQGLAGWRGADGKPAYTTSQATVCVPQNSTAQANIRDYLTRTGRNWTTRGYPTLTDAFQAFLGRECTVLSVDRSMLITLLRALHGPMDDVSVSPEVISHEPVAPVVSNRDRTWLTIVRWTMNALFLADQKGVDSLNVAQKRASLDDSEVHRLLNGVPGAAKAMGLNNDWAYQVIKQVGNYGEIFSRNLGAASQFGMARGPNRPWDQGGLLYAMPFQ